MAVKHHIASGRYVLGPSEVNTECREVYEVRAPDVELAREVCLGAE
jgi:hypothetical protein